MIVSGSDDNTIKIWDCVTGRLIGTLVDHTGSVNSVACSSVNQMIVSGSDDLTIKIYNLL